MVIMLSFRFIQKKYYYFYFKDCVIEKRAVQDMEYLNRFLTIYADFKFNCSGKVVSYEFFAKKTGRFYVSAWRPVVDKENTWTMIDYNNITVSESGLQVRLQLIICKTLTVYIINF